MFGISKQGMYIQRWLKTPVLTKSNNLINKQGKGTPQGGVISPLLANLFLHYTFDKWLENFDKTVNFARYADVVHNVARANSCAKIFPISTFQIL